MKTKMFMSMLVIALAAALVGGATMAIFTDTATNTGNTFTAGTVDVMVYDNTSFVTLTPVSITNMAPGDTRSSSFVVRNAGTLDLRFDVSATPTGALFGGTHPAEVLTLADDQNVVLIPGGFHTVNYSVYLPFGAGNEYQGAAGTVNFTIAAEQTANNP
jgi:predicted ribosomally synthesized peptide with SipW-like signal peptide